MLPQTNLPLNLPLVQNLPPQNFQIKDQHLLKPPQFMGGMSNFGRRASDGGANLHGYYQQQHNTSGNVNGGNIDDGCWSQPGSREHLQSVRYIYFFFLFINKSKLFYFISLNKNLGWKSYTWSMLTNSEYKWR